MNLEQLQQEIESSNEQLKNMLIKIESVNKTFISIGKTIEKVRERTRQNNINIIAVKTLIESTNVRN